MCWCNCCPSMTTQIFILCFATSLYFGVNNMVHYNASVVETQGYSLRDKTAIVVGGTDGIGFAIADRLAKAGADVHIYGQNMEKGAAIVKEWSNKYPEQRFLAKKVDASSVWSMHQAATAWDKAYPDTALDYLVLTAGIFNIAGVRIPTPEDLPQDLALHSYARFAFIDPLLEALQSSEDGRVLSVFNGGMPERQRYTNWLGDPELDDNFNYERMGIAAGYYNDIALDSFARENEQVTFIHADPGWVNTQYRMKGAPSPAVEYVIWAWQLLVAKQPYLAGELMSRSLLLPEFQGGFHILDEYGQKGQVLASHERDRPGIWRNIQRTMTRYVDFAGEPKRIEGQNKYSLFIPTRLAEREAYHFYYEKTARRQREQELFYGKEGNRNLKGAKLQYV